MDYNEFAEKIKVKYPEYKDMDNKDLAQRIVAKYPEYESQVTFDVANKGIDITPSGLVKKAVSYPAAGLRSLIKGEDYNTAREKTLEAYEQVKPLKGITDTAFDIATYSRLPMLKGASTAGKIGAFGGNALIQGGLPGTLEGLKQGDALSGAKTGTGVALGVQTALSSLPFVGKTISKAINNPQLQQGIANTLEAFTSVPKDYTKTAIQKELTGNSIFKGKFDADTAYQPVERKLREAKEMLPTATDFGDEYYKLGQKAVQGMENLEQQAGAEIEKVLAPLNNREVQNGGIKNAVNSIIESYGQGGVYNSAREQAPNVVRFLEDKLSKEGLTLMDLHRIKKDLYNMGYAFDDIKQGTSAEVARKAAEQINNYLRGVSPSYARPNDVYSMVIDTTNGLKSSGTIGEKISNIGTAGNAKTGLDQRLKAVDKLLPNENKFYNQAQNVIDSENEINQIKNTIGKQYERNPRLLANRTDEAFETALNNLQNKTGINFMDELQDLRAREAFEKWFPGQGGGSGSSQGFGNLLRTAIIGGTPTAAAITHNPMALAGLGLVSPKFAGKGTIQNLGRLNNAAQAMQNLSPEEVGKILTPLLIQTGYKQ